MIDFLCIGAQKSGTTLLYEQLKKIDKIYLPKKKELHYFDKDTNYLDATFEYNKYFIDAKDGQIKGEITPAYMFFDKVSHRILTTLGKDIKFIVLLRNPITRAYSHYNMTKNKFSYETLSFEQALITENYRLKTDMDRINYTYQSRGFYSQQILNYFKYFDKKQFKFIIYENFVKNQNFYINDILNFLGIEQEVNIENRVIFKNDYEDMQSSTKEALKMIYRDEISTLENILDINLDIWK